MDTPEKSQIATPVSSKFEDSPVFSYINSLSPIKPLESVHPTVTINSLSFASPPSVFSSPQINFHKESRFLKRKHLADPSRPDVSECETENSTEDNSDALQLPDLCIKQLSCDSPASLARDPSIRAHEEHFEVTKELKYDCESPDINKFLCIPYKKEHTPEREPLPRSLAQFSLDGSKESLYSFESETQLGKIALIEQNGEASEPDWEKLVSDAADLLCFNSSSNEDNAEGQDSKSPDSGTSYTLVAPELSPDNNDSLQKAEVGGSFAEGDMELHVAQPGDIAELKEKDHVPKVLACTLLHEQITRHSNPKVNDNNDKGVESGFKPGFQQQRRIRRLVFDRSEANKRKSVDDNGCACSISLQADCDAVDEKKIVCARAEKGYISPAISGIGLHLNALASSSDSINLVKDEAMANERQLRMMSECSSFDPLISGIEVRNTSSSHSSAEDLGVEGNLASLCGEVPVVGDSTPTFGVEEFNQSSPKKKRRKSEHKESEACKRCKCKKSKCLKLYCDCFAAGLYCVEPCSCQDCFNKPIYEDTVLETRKQIESRNPLAFAPKVITSSESTPEFGDDRNKTPASARHKRGCNCKKSSCQKKYCECFQGGVGCSISCRCEGCKNPFGYKYGTEETELEMEGALVRDKNASDESLHHDVVHKVEEPLCLFLPATPSFEIGRSLVQLPRAFSGEYQQPCNNVGASPHRSKDRKLEKLDSPHHLPKFGRRLQMIPENETIGEILLDSCSLPSCVKSMSPNHRRVSPPHCGLGSFSALRNGRKLILKSIPSFSSLTPCDNTDN